jgi:hypothetical protein
MTVNESWEYVLMEIHHPLSSLRVTVDASKSRKSSDLVLHFHGAPDIVTAAVRDRFPDAIAATINLNGLSGAYQSYVGRSPHWMFVKLLAELQQATGTKQFDSITLSSFSAGYGAIRALLDDPRCVELIDQLVLADTVYASFGHQRNSLGSRPFPSYEQNKPFVDFAKLAVMGKKGMVLTHCELEPETYSSTEEVGQLVRDAIGVRLIPVNEVWSKGLRIKGHVRKGRFVSVATRGNQGSDHVAHLQGIGTWYRLIPRF